MQCKQRNRARVGLSIVLLTCLAVLAMEGPAAAGEIPLSAHSLPGDGKTPSFLQYLDTNGLIAKPAASLASSSAKGDVVYSVALDLPPALLAPALSFNYASASGMDLEMGYAWSLGGIAEIRRPLARAYTDDEWLVSGPGFSGVLVANEGTNAKIESRRRAERYRMRASSPVLVSATYADASDTWKIYANGLTWELSAKDAGKDTPDGTATWRADKMYDNLGNTVIYAYHDDGRIKKISYGGNETTGDPHLVDVAFSYERLSNQRTNARAGFVVTYKYYLTLVTVSEYSASETSALDSAVTELKSSESSDRDIFYAFDLEHTETDGLDLLTKIEREGKSADDAETIASFSYSKFDWQADPERTSTEPPSSLGESDGYVESSP